MPPGPPPKRSEERHRRNEPTIKATKVDLTEPPAADLDPDSLPFKIRQPIVIPQHDGVFVDVEGEVIEEQARPDGGQPWHPIVRDLWESFSRSGQALYWQPSDWAVATFVCEAIDRELQPQIIGYEEHTDAEGGSTKIPIWGEAPIKGATLSAILKASGVLMLVEGERRRLGFELTSRYAKDLEAGPATEQDVEAARAGLFVVPASS